ncbi:SDR family NAD(P)-dependent oxidoreductase [Pacificimonas sp. WHA3]|uniref:SDR family NAD(P)-dependent oxidoreductase n=1 Tax=Pacificimonas pallii TaxID=2827236 RepID=A0ABS6SCI3_9SPHN|nr:SDR family NAD(P)-dependent oxidoreductase [Pacificimonas pallii]MBV7256124.1 SDR family NAD(P)-dependent oxidoreductase [Pacificimonas pallii]
MSAQFKGRRILLTGATGGLGFACARELIARGHEVRAVGRQLEPGQALEALGAEFLAFDLEEEHDLTALLRGYDSVIHAAALSASWGGREAFESANVDVTRRLLNAAAKRSIKRFVFISSPSIFASFEDRVGIGESDLPVDPPLNYYAQSKRAAERLVLASRDDALACSVIRPRALVGEGDRVILPKLVELAAREKIPMPRDGKALIELTDLRDAAWAICEAEERADDLKGRAINISGGNPRAVKEVAQQLAQALGKSPRFVTPRMPLLRVLAASLEGLAKLTGREAEPLLTRYTLATLAYSQSFDLAPAKRLLDYAPRYDGLATLLEQAHQMAGMGEPA